MSKVWGAGFHTGKTAGFEEGNTSGITVGQLYAAEHAWHCVNAAIRAIEAENESEALGILRVLKFMLADATGHEMPQITPGDKA